MGIQGCLLLLSALLMLTSLVPFAFCLHRGFLAIFLSFFRHLDPCQHASQHHQQLELAVQPFAASIIVLHSLTVNSNFTCDCSLPALVSSSVPVFPRTVSFSVPLHRRFPRWRCPQVQSWRPFSLQFPLGTRQV